MAFNTFADLSVTPANNLNLLNQNATGTADANTIDTLLQNFAAMTARFYGDVGGLGTVGGSANAITVSSLSTYQTLENGLIISFKAGSINTAATTLNLDGLGVKAIRRKGDAALEAGDIAANGRYLVMYDESYNAASGAWVLMNPESIGAATTSTLTNKTLTSPAINTPTLVLKQSAAPTPTAEGDLQWDTDDDMIVVGDGAAQKTFFSGSNGSWTPDVSFGNVNTGITYSSRVGTFVRFGKLYICSFAIIMTSKGAATGTARIGGLPGTIATDFGGALRNFQNVSSVTTQLVFNSVAAATTFIPRQTSGNLDNTNFNNNSEFYGFYMFTVA